MFKPFAWIKPKRVALRALTSVPRLAEVLPVTKLSKSLPDWWRSLPPMFDVPAPARPDPQMPPQPLKQLTAKHCYAMQEAFKTGLGIPLWADYVLSMAPDGRIQPHAPGKGRPGDQHPSQQFTGMLSPNSAHFKFNSPWWIVADRPVHFWMCHPFYHQRDPFRFHAMPGATEFYNQHATNVNIVVRRTGKPTDIEFTAGEMIAYLIPMDDVRVDLVVEEVSDAELDRINYTKNITIRPILFNRKRNRKNGEQSG
jgi:hypothetical protein